MTAAIESSDLSRRFGRTDAVKELTVNVPAGSVFALIGPNGAGKTTTIKLLMNLVRPTSGIARVMGVDSRRLGAREFERIGYVSENQHLPDWMSPGQLLEYCRPFYPTWDADLARKLQGDLGLATRTPLRHLSRGTRVKAALLASLVYRPELVILDEPFSGLDPLVRDELIRSLLEVSADEPRTVFVSSHDVEEIERLADWVGFMAEGRLVFAEPVAAARAFPSRRSDSRRGERARTSRQFGVVLRWACGANAAFHRHRSRSSGRGCPDRARLSTRLYSTVAAHVA